MEVYVYKYMQCMEPRNIWETMFWAYTEVARLFCTQTVHLGPAWVYLAFISQLSFFQVTVKRPLF